MTLNRKDAIREYKERKPNRGVYSYTCVASGAVWVESTPNLVAARNFLESSLRHGSHRNQLLQAHWNQHRNFEFTVLENFAEDVSDLALKDLYKDRRTYWSNQLSAPTINP